VPEGQGPLERAIIGYGVNEVQRIVAMGAPLTAEFRLDAKGCEMGTAVDLAILYKRYKLALQLLGGTEGNALARLSTRALAWSAREGQANLVRELLRLGATPGQCDELGRSALLLATMRGRSECAAMLLDAGAWQVEGASETVLEWASHFKMACFSTS